MVDRDFYEVEAILRHRGNPRKKSTMQFLVKWQGYDESANTWQSLKDLAGNAVLEEYVQKTGLSIRK